MNNNFAFFLCSLNPGKTAFFSKNYFWVIIFLKKALPLACMGTFVYSAALCPLRSTDEGLEVLLTRRAFWNAREQRPMRYPGEWTFASGSYAEGDACLLETALREFREEVRYAGDITDTRFLRSGTGSWQEKIHVVLFYAARLASQPEFSLVENGEVIAVDWFRPQQALTLIQSDDFSRDQAAEFQRRGLDDPRFGIYAVSSRQFPVQNVATLELIHARETELREAYHEERWDGISQSVRLESLWAVHRGGI